MLTRLNQILQKLMPLITPISVVLGVLCYQVLDSFLFLVPWIFAFMTFSGSLNSSFSNLKKVLKHPLSLVVTLMILHVFMPLIANYIGKWIFPTQPYYVIGLILAFVIPTGITSLIWVSIYKGNVSWTLSIILVDTLLSPIMVPIILKWLVDSTVEMHIYELMKGLLWMIVFPSLLGMCVNQWLKKELTEKLSTTISPLAKLGVGAVVAINSAGVAPYIRNFNIELLLIALVVFTLAILAYGLGCLAGIGINQPRNTIISMIYNSGMRNISAGAVLAITYFPAPVAVPVIVGMLFQQVLASSIGMIIEKKTHHLERNQALPT